MLRIPLLRFGPTVLLICPKLIPEKPVHDRVHHMQKYNPVVIATNKFFPSERSWNCPLCDCGLPELGK